MVDNENKDYMNEENGNNIGDIAKIATPLLLAFISCIFSYRLGSNRGYKKGIKDASKIYEKKLKKQTEDFLNAKKSLEVNLEEYTDLIRAYESYICELEERLADGENVGEVVDFLKLKEKELENLKDV